MALTVNWSSRFVTIFPDKSDIEGLSRANPCVVSWTGHGLSSGDVVSFSDILQAEWQSLNGNSYAVTVIDNNSFSIPVNTSGFGSAYNATSDPGKVGTDFDITRYFANGLRLTAINWHSPWEGDTLVLRDGGPDGPIFYKRTDGSGTGLHQSISGHALKIKVYMKASDQVFWDSGDVTVMLEFE